MTVDVIYKRENIDFNQDYADKYQFGKESDGNWRYDINESFRVQHVQHFELLKNSSCVINHTIDQTPYAYIIPNVVKLSCVKSDGTLVEFSVSKSLILKIQKTPNKKYDIVRVYFYLQPSNNIIQWRTNLIDIKDVPRELSET